MSQIEITILKQGIPSRKVLTCCFFTSSDSYRDFSVYRGNLKRFAKDSEHLTDFEIRVYTDDSGKDYALEITENYPRITVLHYNCPEFRNGKGHDGMFGTLVRFLPLFEDLDVVWCSDIDISTVYLDPKTLTEMQHYKADIYYNAFICYETFTRGRVNAIVAFKFITKVKFPRALLTRFLNMIQEGKLEKQIEDMKRENSATIKKQSDDSKFPYGMDEFFINTYIYNWIVNKNLRVLVDKDYSAYWLLFNLTSEEKNVGQKYRYFPSLSSFNKLKKILLNATPLPAISVSQCYTEFREVLPKLRNGFVVRKLIHGKDLEKN